MPKIDRWGVEARAVASAAHQSGRGRRQPPRVGVTAASSKRRTKSSKFRVKNLRRRARRR